MDPPASMRRNPKPNDKKGNSICDLLPSLSGRKSGIGIPTDKTATVLEANGSNLESADPG
jgi:hypothetical protein